LLFLTPRFPFPVDRGDRIRSYHLIREFSRHADITLATMTDGAPGAVPMQSLSPWCSRVEVISLPKRRSELNMVLAVADHVPFQVAYFRSADMDRLLDRLSRERFDLAFAHMFRMLPYLERCEGVRRVVDLGDSLAMNLQRALAVKPLLARFAFQEERKRVARYEVRAMASAHESWVITEPDRVDLLSRAPSARLEVVPNGIERRWGRSGLDGPKSETILFLGNLTVGHNVDAARYLAEEIWPLVLRERPSARLLLVGTPNRSVQRLTARPGVRVEGFVPDLAPFLARARASVAPLRYGAGIQNKVLETMAAGLPAVVTPMVADPIGAEPGKEIVVGESPDDLAGEIVRLLSDERLARRIGEAGSLFVTTRFSWARAGDRMREILAA
jgi:sugar transferase (PEP-CTERM/EpsH1 system associated)